MEQETKKPLYRKKTIIIPAILFLLATVVTAAVLFATINVDVTVNEALSATIVDMSVAGYPGETKTETFTVDNSASVPLQLTLTWTETNNVNGVTYTTDMPKTLTVSPGANTVEVTFNIDSDSPTGTFEGEITLERS